MSKLTAVKMGPNGEPILCESKSPKGKKTLTNGTELLMDQTADELSFVKDGNWWHIEPANTNYNSVHYEHGRALARDFVRYVRATEDGHALGRVFRDMVKPSDWRKRTVAEGFMHELNRVLLDAKRLDIYQ